MQIDGLRRYDWWLLEGWRETHFATHSTPPTVIFLTSRERPLRRLVETADRVLSAWYGREDAGPRAGTHPARERILFTSRERIRASDWTMGQTPSLPPVLREEPDAIGSAAGGEGLLRAGDIGHCTQLDSPPGHHSQGRRLDVGERRVGVRRVHASR